MSEDTYLAFAEQMMNRSRQFFTLGRQASAPNSHMLADAYHRIATKYYQRALRGYIHWRRRCAQ